MKTTIQVCTQSDPNIRRHSMIISQVGFDDKQLRYRVKLHSDGSAKVVAKKNMKVLTYQDIFPPAPSPGPAPSASSGPDSWSIWSFHGWRENVPICANPYRDDLFQVFW